LHCDRIATRATSTQYAPIQASLAIVAALAAHFQSFTQIAPKEETFGPEHVSVARVDLLTPHAFKLYVDRLELLGQADPSLAPEPPVVYAACTLGARG
jgi:hypothetical protein